MIKILIIIDNPKQETHMELTKISEVLTTSLADQEALIEVATKLATDLETAKAKLAELEGTTSGTPSTDAADQATIDALVAEVNAENEKIKAIVAKYQTAPAGGTTDGGSTTPVEIPAPVETPAPVEPTPAEPTPSPAPADGSTVPAGTTDGGATVPADSSTTTTDGGSTATDGTTPSADGSTVVVPPAADESGAPVVAAPVDGTTAADGTVPVSADAPIISSSPVSAD